MRFTRTLSLSLALLAAGFFTISRAGQAHAAAVAPSHAFGFAILTGADEVPPVKTDGIGAAVVRPLARERFLFFVLATWNLEDIIFAHIHLAPPGENGPVVAFLFHAEDPVTRDGVLSFGFLTADDLVGPLEGQEISDLLDEIRAGNAYINVHTKAHPSGEIRGQIEGLNR